MEYKIILAALQLSLKEEMEWECSKECLRLADPVVRVKARLERDGRHGVKHEKHKKYKKYKETCNKTPVSAHLVDNSGDELVDINKYSDATGTFLDGFTSLYYMLIVFYS